MKRLFLFLILILVLAGGLSLFFLHKPKGKVFSSLTDFTTAIDPASLIVFVSNRDGNDEIYLTDKKGLFLKRITNTPQNEFGPDFSLVTQEIAYFSEDSDFTTIWLYAFKNQNKRLLSVTREKPRLLKFSPDGQFLTFWQDGPVINEGSDLYLIRTRDGKMERLASRVVNFSWSTDSKSVIFSERETNRSIVETKIMIKNIEGEELTMPALELTKGGVAPVFLSANKILFLDVTVEYLKLISMSLRGENKEEIIDLGIKPQEETNYFLIASPLANQLILQISSDRITEETLFISLTQKTIEKLSLETKSLKWLGKGEAVFTAKDGKGNLQLWLKEKPTSGTSLLTTTGNNWL